MHPPVIPSAIDRLIHEPVRLGVMSILAQGYTADFTFLREALEVSDGNLAAHLMQLADAGYIAVAKRGGGRSSRTTYTATAIGKDAYQQYARAMARLLMASATNPTAPDAMDRDKG